MLKRSTIFLISSLFLTSCATVSERTRFPIAPEPINYNGDFVIKYNSENRTYLVREELVVKSVRDHLYLKAILNWKKENNIN